MLSYSEFETKVKELTPEYEQWKHLLPAIPHQSRRRYLDTLQAGWDMPQAFDIVQTSTSLADDAFAHQLEKRRPGLE